MKILPLIGCSLKSDEIIELLEFWGADVVYDFDRLHENVPDAYRVNAEEAGIEMLFDAAQSLTTVFLRIQGSADSSVFAVAQSDVPSFDSIEDAAHFAATKGLSVSKGNSDFLGQNRTWIKLDFATHTVHYEFIDGVLHMVTVNEAT